MYRNLAGALPRLEFLGEVGGLQGLEGGPRVTGSSTDATGREIWDMSCTSRDELEGV